MILKKQPYHYYGTLQSVEFWVNKYVSLKDFYESSHLHKWILKVK